MLRIPNEDQWMIKAIEVAEKNKTPYGCLILNHKSLEYILFANSVKKDGKTAHAEMNALRNLDQLAYSEPQDLILFTTGEPCPMCMGAIIWSGIRTVRYGMDIETISLYQKQIMVTARLIASRSWLDMDIKGGILKNECRQLFDNLYGKPD